MYKCGKCGILYDLMDEHYSYLGDECKKHDIARSVIICPDCKKKRIVGGESDWIDGEDAIMMFGHDIEHHNVDITELKSFEGILINE